MMPRECARTRHLAAVDEHVRRENLHDIRGVVEKTRCRWLVMTAESRYCANAPPGASGRGIAADSAHSPLTLRLRDQMRVKVSPSSSSKRLA
jgi:hypothetical protein